MADKPIKKSTVSKAIAKTAAVTKKAAAKKAAPKIVEPVVESVVEVHKTVMALPQVPVDNVVPLRVDMPVFGLEPSADNLDHGPRASAPVLIFTRKDRESRLSRLRNP